MQTINLKQYYPFCTEDTFVGSYTPQTHRRRKVRFVSFPPYGENCTRSLAPLSPRKPLRWVSVGGQKSPAQPDTRFASVRLHGA